LRGGEADAAIQPIQQTGAATTVIAMTNDLAACCLSQMASSSIRSAATRQSSQSNTRRGMRVQFGPEFAAKAGYNLQASAFLRHIYAELREPPTPIHVTNAK